jgi:DNA-binding response OmpR family regulator
MGGTHCGIKNVMRKVSWDNDHSSVHAEPRSARESTLILVVDDDRAIAHVIELILHSRGFHVKVAHSGHDALDMMVECEPDVLLLDVMLPEMDGYELLEKLIEMRAVTREAVIMVSAMTSDADLQRGRDAGVFSYLRKPFRSDQLIMAVEECLELRRSATSKFR